MSKLSVFNQLIMLISLPLLFLLFFSGKELVSFNKEIVKQQNQLEIVLKLSELVDLTIQLGDLIHEIQIERGRTSVFLSAPNNETFFNNLLLQRKNTDIQLQKLQVKLQKFNQSNYSVRFQKQLNLLVQELKMLVKMRQNIDNQSISIKETLYFYTNINTQALNTIEETSSLTHNKDFFKVILAYVNILKAKENTGLERAILSNVFLVDAFTTENFSSFIRVKTNQTNFLAQFERFSVDSTFFKYQKMEESKEFEEVSKMEEIALSKVTTGGFGIDANDWFVTISVKCDKLKAIENELALIILQKAQKLESTIEQELYQAKSVFYIVAFLMFSVVVILVWCSIVISKNIINAFSFLKIITQEISQGNLDQTIEIQGSKDVREVLTHLKNMVAKLKIVLSKVTEVGISLQKSSSDITIFSEQLSVGALQQANSIQMLSSTVEQVLYDVKQNTEDTKQVNKITNHVTHKVTKTSDLMNETVQALQNVVGKIVVISEISRQTDLLALNAAVEAARAGQYGRGFAVVASEVRKLAENSRISAEEIDVLSDKSVMITSDSQGQLSSILPQVITASNLLQKITDSSIQQVSGIHQIHSSMMGFSDVVQQNAQSSQQVYKDIQQLKSQSDDLLKEISFFKLKIKNI